jgi:hypothetical protein
MIHTDSGPQPVFHEPLGVEGSRNFPGDSRKNISNGALFVFSLYDGTISNSVSFATTYVSEKFTSLRCSLARKTSMLILCKYLTFYKMMEHPREEQVFGDNVCRSCRIEGIFMAFQPHPSQSKVTAETWLFRPGSFVLGCVVVYFM